MYTRKKDGFTLIEMLVVIAIIAVLVSITIPVVVNHNNKAAAAANAANLRSAYAAFLTERELNPNALDGLVGIQYLTAQNDQFTFGDITIPAPPSKAVKTSNVTINANLPMKAYVSEDSVYVFYHAPSYEYMFFAEIIENGEATVCTGWADANGDHLCDNCGRPADYHILEEVGKVEEFLCKKLGYHPDSPLDPSKRDGRCDYCGCVINSCEGGKHTDNTNDCICDSCHAQMNHTYPLFDDTCSNCGHKKTPCEKGNHTDENPKNCVCDDCKKDLGHIYILGTCIKCGNKK